METEGKQSALETWCDDMLDSPGFSELLLTSAASRHDSSCVDSRNLLGFSKSGPSSSPTDS